MRRFKVMPYTPAADKIPEIVEGYEIVRISLDNSLCIVRVKANVNATQAEPIYTEEEMRQYLRVNREHWENDLEL